MGENGDSRVEEVAKGATGISRDKEEVMRSRLIGYVGDGIRKIAWLENGQQERQKKKHSTLQENLNGRKRNVHWPVFHSTAAARFKPRSSSSRTR